MRWLAALALCFSLSAHALTAEAYVALDLDTGEVLLEKNADAERPIASITKLFIAQEALALEQAELLTVTKADVKAGMMRSSPLRAGSAYTRAQLIELALVSSDNIAAITLGRTTPEANNAYATILEPSGLNPKNKSTARAIAIAAASMYETELARISVKTMTEIGSKHSTNPLLTKAGWSFYLSKTGFIKDSGGCLVTILAVKEKLTVITILGAKDTKQRWADLAELRRMLGDDGFYVPAKVRVAKLKHQSRRHCGRAPC